MADLVLDVQSAPVTPAAGQGTLFVDTLSKLPAIKNDAGFVTSFGPTNFSTVAQSPAAATRTYITGSALTVPSGKLQVGSSFRWLFTMTKTAAGIAASTIDIAVGTTGTTTDTARVSFTKPAGTAVVDEGTVIVNAICRGPVGASGIFAGNLWMVHNLQITGHLVIPCISVTTISSAFDITTAGLIVGLCLTSGASDAITIQLVQAEAWNL